MGCRGLFFRCTLLSDINIISLQGVTAVTETVMPCLEQRISIPVTCLKIQDAAGVAERCVCLKQSPKRANDQEVSV